MEILHNSSLGVCQAVCVCVCARARAHMRTWEHHFSGIREGCLRRELSRFEPKKY